MKRLIAVVVGVICLVCVLAGCAKCPGLEGGVDPVTGMAVSCSRLGPLYYLKADDAQGGVFSIGIVWGDVDK